MGEQPPQQLQTTGECREIAATNARAAEVNQNVPLHESQVHTESCDFRVLGGALCTAAGGVNMGNGTVGISGKCLKADQNL